MPTPYRRPAAAALVLALALLADVANAQRKPRKSSASKRPSAPRAARPSPNSPAARPSSASPAPARPAASAARAAVAPAAGVAAGAAVAAAATSSAPNAGDAPNAERPPAGAGDGAADASTSGVSRPRGRAWRAGDRIEVAVDGLWRRGSVVSSNPVRPGQLFVRTDPFVDGTVHSNWTSTWNVRRAFYTANNHLPPGRYACAERAGARPLGRLRLLPNGTYTGPSADGAGAGGRYLYDARSDAIAWAGGLRGFPGAVTETRVVRNRGGQPVVAVGYRAGEKGARYVALCTYEGA